MKHIMKLLAENLKNCLLFFYRKHSLQARNSNLFVLQQVNYTRMGLHHLLWTRIHRSLVPSLASFLIGKWFTQHAYLYCFFFIFLINNTTYMILSILRWPVQLDSKLWCCSYSFNMTVTVKRPIVSPVLLCIIVAYSTDQHC